MKITETLYFDEDKYLDTISSKYFSHIALAKEIYRKRAKKLSSKVRTGVGILAATVTGGASLVGSAISARNISVENQKLELLEAEWEARGHPPLPKNKLKDKIIPITIAVGTSLFTVGIDVALSAASPDQFYQMIPDPAVNDWVISEYYTVVDKGLASAGNFVANKVVSVGRGENYGSGGSSAKTRDRDRYHSREKSEKYYEDRNDYYGRSESYSSSGVPSYRTRDSYDSRDDDEKDYYEDYHRDSKSSYYSNRSQNSRRRYYDD